jgi:hypothetical protein
LGSKSSVPLDDCQTWAGPSDPSYQTGVKRVAAVVSGWGASIRQSPIREPASASSRSSLGATRRLSIAVEPPGGSSPPRAAGPLVTW